MTLHSDIPKNEILTRRVPDRSLNNLHAELAVFGASRIDVSGITDSVATQLIKDGYNGVTMQFSAHVIKSTPWERFFTKSDFQNPSLREEGGVAITFRNPERIEDFTAIIIRDRTGERTYKRRLLFICGEAQRVNATITPDKITDSWNEHKLTHEVVHGFKVGRGFQHWLMEGITEFAALQIYVSQHSDTPDIVTDENVPYSEQVRGILLLTKELVEKNVMTLEQVKQALYWRKGLDMFARKLQEHFKKEADQLFIVSPNPDIMREEIAGYHFLKAAAIAVESTTGVHRSVLMALSNTDLVRALLHTHRS